jgi:hypothetical protein
MTASSSIFLVLAAALRALVQFFGDEFYFRAGFCWCLESCPAAFRHYW